MKKLFILAISPILLVLGDRLASGGGGYISSQGVATPVTVANGGTGTSTAFTAGSVIFAGTGGTYNQNNANFFWDNTNARLGLGTAAPASILHLSRNPTPAIEFTDTSQAVGLKNFEMSNLSGQWQIRPTDDGITSYQAVGLIFTHAGRMGINVNPPAVDLDVNGASIFRATMTIISTLTVTGNAFSVGGTTFSVSNGSVSIKGIAFIGGSGSGGSGGAVNNSAILIVQSTSTTGGYGIADFRNNSGNSAFFFAQNGQLGLATTAPNDMISSGGPTVVDQIGTGNTGGSGITLTPSAAGYGLVILNQSAAATANGFLIKTTGVTATNKILALNANGTDVGVMTGAGFFGVGTSTPSTKMHMSSGTLTIDGNVSPAIDVLNGLTGLWSRTKAQIDGITPGRAGQMLYCSDCASVAMCISTGTTLSGFKRSDSTTAGCGSGN